MLWETFQALAQRKVTKVVPEGLPELKRWGWVPRETKADTGAVGR